MMEQPGSFRIAVRCWMIISVYFELVSASGIGKGNSSGSAIMRNDTADEFISNTTEINTSNDTNRISGKRGILGNEIPGWGRNASRYITDYVHPFKDTTLISGRGICIDGTKTLIVIPSAPKDFEVRSLIRETWASDVPNEIRIGFLLGLCERPHVQNAVFLESKKYKDIIQDSFLDSYYNLTLKSIIMLKWFIFKCPVARFLMKLDSDTYLSLRRLTRVMASIGTAERGILLGRSQSHLEPYRNLDSDWYMPKYMYGKDVYPKYLSGMAYLMSRDVAEKLYAAALVTPIVYMEDLYITGICAEVARVEPASSREFLRGCPSLLLYVACHPAPPPVLQTLWATSSHQTAQCFGFAHFLVPVAIKYSA